WMGGAGFLIEYRGVRVGLDLYLSDACRRADGSFKRMTPAPRGSEGLRMDYLISSHEHGDHMDLGSVGTWFHDNPGLTLIGPATSIKAAEGVAGKLRHAALERGDRIGLGGGVEVAGVFCDHGEGCPDALGIVLRLGGYTVYFTGDTRHRPDLRDRVLESMGRAARGGEGAAADGEGCLKVDLMLVPINPAFGNPGTEGAASMVRLFGPAKVIPCHYWLFKEHGAGDPGGFEELCAATAPETECVCLAVGEGAEFWEGGWGLSGGIAVP
ncbi:MAG: MBL fold metallo-hydrolase, partial [Oscillospiraceae bacterium]|nr:MBL fold metallo-hydrolase [Oscillospiraceae bacterium]